MNLNHDSAFDENTPTETAPPTQHWTWRVVGLFEFYEVQYDPQRNPFVGFNTRERVKQSGEASVTYEELEQWVSQRYTLTEYESDNDYCFETSDLYGEPHFKGQRYELQVQDDDGTWKRVVEIQPVDDRDYWDDAQEDEYCDVCRDYHAPEPGEPGGCSNLGDYYGDECSRDHHQHCTGGPYKGHWCDLGW